MADRLFIPLTTEFYNAFAEGRKTNEYRVYGPRWNERTCAPGRRVLLSKGYGTSDRLEGTVVGFIRRPLAMCGKRERATLARVYPDLAVDVDVAVISIELQRSTA